MPALQPPPPLLLTLLPCAMVAMAVIGTAHANSPAKLQYWEHMKAMMQAADGGGSESGDSQSRAAAVVTFVVDVGAGFRSGQSHGVKYSDRPKSFSVTLEWQGAHVCGEWACWLLTSKHIGLSGLGIGKVRTRLARRTNFIPYGHRSSSYSCTRVPGTRVDIYLITDGL